MCIGHCISIFAYFGADAANRDIGTLVQGMRPARIVDKIGGEVTHGIDVPARHTGWASLFLSPMGLTPRARTWRRGILGGCDLIDASLENFGQSDL